MKKIITFVLIACLTMAILSGCTEADRVNDITYVVEDVTGAYADKYHYELNILPEMLIPVTITSID